MGFLWDCLFLGAMLNFRGVSSQGFLFHEAWIECGKKQVPDSHPMMLMKLMSYPFIMAGQPTPV